MMIKEDILDLLQHALKKSGIEDKINLDRPPNDTFGDYSTTIALKLAKKIKKNPWEIAENIVKNIPKNDLIKKIQIIKPGFINIFLAENYLIEKLKKISKNLSYPLYHLGKNKKIIVEFAHPNTHKLFHIGHLRNITIGESLVRILQAVGNQVIRVNYQGDVGLHIAKCLYKIKNQKLKIKNLKTIKEKMDFIGKMYSEGTKAYEEDEKAKKEIIEINKMIYNQDKEILSLWKKTRQWSLDYFDAIYKRVDSYFDRFYFESEMTKRGVEIVMMLLKKKILERSQGAIIFNGKKYGLDTRVFLNSYGYPTYEGKELALAEKEFSEFGEIDKCIHVVTPEQKSFFQVTFKVEELIDEKKYKNKQYHLMYEWVKLKTGKMSSRQGNVIEADWLIDKTKEKIIKKYNCEEKIAEVLALAAVKYSFLKNDVKNVIAFDFDESISLEGNSGPYLLYTYVRTQSVLKKAGLEKNIFDNFNNNYNLNSQEISLLKNFYFFPEVVKNAAENFAPNYIAFYLYDLAQKFNVFYQKCPIIKTEKQTKNFRLLITKTAGFILQEGLRLLGIKTIDKM